jgi:hypothetical protein
MLDRYMHNPATVFHRNPELVPTLPNYGIKAAPLPMKLGTKSGILMSTRRYIRRQWYAITLPK